MKPEAVCAVDRNLRESHFTALRLPPFHCDPNPIERNWSLLKHSIATKKKLVSLAVSKGLAHTRHHPACGN